MCEIGLNDIFVYFGFRKIFFLMFGGVLFGEVGIFEVIIFFVKIMEFNDKFV